MPNLMWLFVSPFLAAFILFFLPKSLERSLKAIAVGMSLAPLALLISSGSWEGVSVEYAWIDTLGIRFHLSVDSLSLLFLSLVAVIIPLSLLAIDAVISYPRAFYGLVLLVQGLLIGFFTARDLALFTFFWEAMLLPLYFMLNLWGDSGRQQTSLKFIIYMFAGSVFMIAASLALYFSAGSSFDMAILAQKAQGSSYALWIFAAFMLAFAVKTPLFPFHSWLPDAYCHGPISGSILLSAILSKAGVYGILRIGMELFPRDYAAWSPLLLGFAVAGTLYGAVAALGQKDFKRLLAYSSFSHINFLLAGIFISNELAHTGALLQVVNHAISITGLFLVAGWLEKRLGSTSMQQAGGLAKTLPVLCWISLFFVMSSIALPGLNNFVGEFVLLFGIFTYNPWLAFILGLTVILGAVYMLRWMQELYFGPMTNERASWLDLGKKELFIILPLILLVLWLGIYPAPAIKHIEAATKKMTTVVLERPL